MIPFQTILALLALLSLVGCSQVPPPKAKFGLDGKPLNQTTQTQGLTGQATPSPTQPKSVIHVGDDGQVPNEKPGKLKAFEIDQSDAGYAVLRFSFVDAQMLYELTEIAPKAGRVRLASSLKSHEEEIEDLANGYMKTGQFYQCGQHENGRYQCAWTVHLVDGSAVEILELGKIKRKEVDPAIRPSADLIKAYFTFKKNPDANQQPFPCFTVDLWAADAKTLHDALKVGEIDGIKKGKHVKCMRDLQKDPTDVNAYHCIQFGQLLTGSFEEIK